MCSSDLNSRTTEVEGEFRQHDGVVMVMMKLPTRGFAEALRQYDRGGNLWRGHCTRLRNQLVCLWGAPSPIYKGEEEEGRPQGARPKGGFLLLVGVGFPLSKSK